MAATSVNSGTTVARIDRRPTLRVMPDGTAHLVYVRSGHIYARDRVHSSWSDERELQLDGEHDWVAIATGWDQLCGTGLLFQPSSTSGAERRVVVTARCWVHG